MTTGPAQAGLFDETPPRPRRKLSPRLSRLLEVLRAHQQGASSREIANATGSVAPHSDCADLRREGFRIVCTASPRTATAPRRYFYRLEEGPHEG